MILIRYFANGPLLGRVNAVVGHNNHLVQYNDLGQFYQHLVQYNDLGQFYQHLVQYNDLG